MGVTDVDIRPILTRIVLMFFVILTGFFMGKSYKCQNLRSITYYRIGQSLLLNYLEVFMKTVAFFVVFRQNLLFTQLATLNNA